MHTIATFRSSAFNTTEEREYFINPCCFGDDLGRWLIAGLRAQGVPTDAEPGQEDFGWYFDFETPDGPHSCVLSFRPGTGEDEGEWVLWLEKAAGLLGSLLGRRRRVAWSAVSAVHGVLSRSSDVRTLLWHEKKAFDAGEEGKGASVPTLGPTSG